MTLPSIDNSPLFLISEPGDAVGLLIISTPLKIQLPSFRSALFSPLEDEINFKFLIKIYLIKNVNKSNQ